MIELRKTVKKGQSHSETKPEASPSYPSEVAVNSEVLVSELKEVQREGHGGEGMRLTG